jgi:hypothetical protein
LANGNPIGRQDLRDISFGGLRSLDVDTDPSRERIVKAYRRAFRETDRKIRRLQRLYPVGEQLPRGQRRRLQRLQKSIREELERLGADVSRELGIHKNYAVSNAKDVITKSSAALELGRANFDTFLAMDANAYIKARPLLHRFPSSVNTYEELLRSFNPRSVEYFEDLRTTGLEIIDLTNLAWNPLQQMETELGAAITERLTVGEMTTQLRQNVWGLKKYVRNPGITYKATRLARSEMAFSNFLAQDAWGRETPGINGFRVWFGGGACNGICLQFIGFYRYDDEQPESIPFHPNCGCYITYNLEKGHRQGQHNQDILVVGEGKSARYMDRMTYDHQIALGEDVPAITDRIVIRGSNEFPELITGAQNIRDHVQSRIVN